MNYKAYNAKIKTLEIESARRGVTVYELFHEEQQKLLEELPRIGRMASPKSMNEATALTYRILSVLQSPKSTDEEIKLADKFCRASNKLISSVASELRYAKSRGETPQIPILK